ncbi:MAG: signal peptidase signal peptidase [Candidatus Kaiserbacteria bacterium]|nr:signal peptidase signal peptidase [Candidatus Kaiserbacteria bacterium]
MSDPVMQKDSSLNAIPAVSTPRKNNFLDASLITSFVVAGLVALIIRLFIAAPYIVSGPSMEPNFHDYNYLIVDRLTYRFSEPQRGDVIVFNLPQMNDRALIKRVIGLPGDTVSLSDTEPKVTIINAAHPDGVVLSEPYISPSDFGGTSNAQYTLKKDEYFVLGDNRKVSADSRMWGILPRSDIVGRVLFRLYPLDSIQTLPAMSRYTNL